MQWNLSADRPVYLQLIEQLERALVVGAYPAGMKLPGVRELAAEAAVNPNTMQRALAELEARGLVETQRTAGRTVTANESLLAQVKTALAHQQAQTFLGGMRAIGYSRGQSITLLQSIKEEA